MLYIFLISAIQNISFTLVSRSRNRDSYSYFLVASIVSNSVWFLTFKSISDLGMGIELIIPYTAGSSFGGLTGMYIGIKLERYVRKQSTDEAH
jgi:hypothetical protein